MSTIPEDNLIASTHPDIVLVTFICLTIPHNSLESVSNARDRKSQKRISLKALSDMEAKGLASRLHTIEVGSCTYTLASNFSEGSVESTSITVDYDSYIDPLIEKKSTYIMIAQPIKMYVLYVHDC